MVVSTSKTPLLRSENWSPSVTDELYDPLQLRLTTPFYGGADYNPYPPLLYAPWPARHRSCTSAFLSAVIVLIILSCLTTIGAIFNAYQISFPSDASLLVLDPADNLTECRTWGSSSSIPGTAFLPWEVADFDVPMDERGLFILSRGSLSSGIARVRQSPDVKDLKVSVSVLHRSEEALSGAKICLVERDNGSQGVAVLTPSSWISPKQKLFFVVNVTLPSPTHGLVSQLPKFTIDVPEFALEVDDLSAFDFEAVTLKSTNRPITVKSVVGQAVVVEGKNGKISGSFNATRLLALSTTNNAIDVSAQAHNTQPGQPTVLSLKTSNGALHANISLSSSSRGNFRISSRTTNAPLALALTSSPDHSDAHPVTLRLDASTSNAPAHIALPPAFEGRFMLRTTRFRPKLRVAGPARKLSTSTAAGGGGINAVFGNASWALLDGGERGRWDADLGWVCVSTCKAPATLVL